MEGKTLLYGKYVSILHMIFSECAVGYNRSITWYDLLQPLVPLHQSLVGVDPSQIR